MKPIPSTSETFHFPNIWRVLTSIPEMISSQRSILQRWTTQSLEIKVSIFYFSYGKQHRKDKESKGTHLFLFWRHSYLDACTKINFLMM